MAVNKDLFFTGDDLDAILATLEADEEFEEQISETTEK